MGCMANRKIEENLEQVSLLRNVPKAEAISRLRKALDDRANVVVARAAKIGAALEIQDLMPDMARAFDRLLEKPVASDPQCWGKNALAIALRDLGYACAEPFVRGLRHIQMEPIWGGRSDTAQVLRAPCCAPLPQCTDITIDDLLRCLVDAFADESDKVRVHAAPSIAHMGGADCALLVRLKARIGDTESHVTGQVFDSLLRLEREAALAFVTEFLDSPDAEVSAEAALAMGSSRLAAPLAILKAAWKRERKPDFLRGINPSGLPAAFEFLLDSLQSHREIDASQPPDAR